MTCLMQTPLLSLCFMVVGNGIKTGHCTSRQHQEFLLGNCFIYCEECIAVCTGYTIASNLLKI